MELHQTPEDTLLLFCRSGSSLASLAHGVQRSMQVSQQNLLPASRQARARHGWIDPSFLSSYGSVRLVINRTVSQQYLLSVLTF